MRLGDTYPYPMDRKAGSNPAPAQIIMNRGQMKTINTPQGVYVLASEVEEHIQVMKNALKLAQIELAFASCRDNPEHTICLKCHAERIILEAIGDSVAVP